MRRSVYQTIISILILATMISVFGVFKTSVLLRLETEKPRDCISLISGRNLCQQMLLYKLVIIFCLIITSGLLSFSGRIVK